ncbi:alanine racemase [Pseudophaeobacter sp.]|uniref:alanine racemase n=1 Tax=Pseudophaeobacter sp. TaxID=1971739 RepID=UPI003298BC56
MAKSLPTPARQDSSPVAEGAWCEISQEHLAQNLESTLSHLPRQTRLCAVVKADAYGHGIENIASLLIAQGVGHIGIASNSEARALRGAGYQGAILRLRTATPAEVAAVRPEDVEEMIGTEEGLQALIAHLGHGALPRLHISLNAGGMSRDGLELSTAAGRQSCVEILNMAAGKIAGLCTHFPSNLPGDLSDSIQRFQQDLAWIFANSALRRADVLTHAGSTLTLMAGANPGVDMMRCGAILFGIAGPEPDFRPALTLKSQVISVGCYPKGSTIGYDRTSVLRRDRVLANVALGYANGFSRQLSGRAEVLIRGQACPVLGQVSMNSAVVDVTRLPHVKIGDEVVAFGRQEGCEVTSAMIERLTGTIMADLFTDWGRRNPRMVKDRCAP